MGEIKEVKKDDEVKAKFNSLVEALLQSLNPDGTLKGTALPIGSIIPWHKDFANTPALPDNFLECNGQVISDAESPYDGQTLPDLNGENRFLRGNSSSGGKGGESEVTLEIAEMPAHNHAMNTNLMDTYPGVGPYTVARDDNQPTTTGSKGGGNAHENKPPFFNTVWVMRIK